MTTCRPRRLPGLLLAPLALALLVFPAAAQTTTTGAIAGVVRDAAGDPLAQALVTLAQPGGGEGVTATTDHRGRYRFPLLDPGDYGIAVELLGYPPTRTSAVPVRPGRETFLAMELAATASPSPEPVTLEFDGGVLRTGRAGNAEWLGDAAALPSARGDVRDLLHRSSRFRETGDVEGLPAAHALLLLDGTPFRAARHPSPRAAALPATGFALQAVEAGLAAAVPFGPELPFGASGVLGTHAAVGHGPARGAAELKWSGDVLPGASVEHGDVPEYQEFIGSARLAGSARGGEADYSAGVYVRRIERPVSAAWTVTDAGSEILGEATERGAAVAGLVRPSALEDQAFGGWLAGSLPLSGRHRLQGTLHYVTLPRLQAIDPATGLLSSAEGDDVVAGLALRSTFERSGNELRASFTRSARETVLPDPLPATFFVGDGLALGAAGADGRAAESALRLADAFTLRTGGVDLTFGADVTLTSHEVRQGALDEAFFGGVSQLRAGTGVRTRLEPGPVLVEWSSPVYGAFAAVAFSPLPGLSLRVGARGEREALPTDEVRFDPTWLDLSEGIRNNAADGAGWQVGPRLAASWELDGARRWLLDVDAGIYTERHDRLLLAAWQQFDGNATMQRVHGAVDWPALDTETGWSGSRLLLLSPDFEPVRSRRLSAGLTHRLASATTVQLSAALRSSRNLPQRIDVNLDDDPALMDQHGRAVYGTLEQQGALLAAQPGTGRYFDEYDEVAGIASEASSDYFGVSLALEQELDAGLAFALRYTFSSTRDDWFAGRSGGWRVAAPLDLAQDGWVDGTSDFDVPHRLAAAASWQAPFGAQLAATFRLESGLPFTPGFRYGVDANGDGDAGNDPAFVDAQVAGMGELLADWSCLASATGRFMERNGCRGDALTALDVATRVPVRRFGAATASLTIEALGVLGSPPGVPDAALYLVDPAGSLNTENGRVELPLTANPDFGSRLVRAEGGRRLRIGAALSW